jgi:hypothetical protein
MPIAQPKTQPETSPKSPRAFPLESRSDQLVDRLAIFPKGCFRAMGTVQAVPLAAAAGVTSAATYFAATFLQLFLVMIYGDKKGEIGDKLGKEFFGYLETAKSKSEIGGKAVIDFEWSQFKEAVSELCGQEDFTKHQLVPADIIKKVEVLTPDEAQEVLDNIDGRAALDAGNASFGLNDRGR